MCNRSKTSHFLLGLQYVIQVSMVENDYTKLISVRMPKELLEKLEADRHKYGCWRESLSRVIVRVLDAHYKYDMPTTQSK